MSNVIDQRVVEMQFDNSNFERNVAQSIDSLKRMDDAINQAGSGDGLGAIGTAVETISHKFSVFETIAVGALLNIGRKAEDMAEKMVKSLTVDNIAAGWDKYAQKTSGVQTIMAATGLSIGEVNEQLEKLMQFTDETSYNFVDMVGNIGKFTSNGVSLEKSVNAMQGIANWAALSGANSQAASRAMYNLSQAMSLGAVKLQDWRSIQGANMATKEFKEEVIRTALELGTIKEVAQDTFQAIGDSSKNALQFTATKAFDDSLAKGWFTGEVLTQALGNFNKFSDEALKFSSKYDTTVSEFISHFDDFKDGIGTLESYANDLGIDVSVLQEEFTKLSGSEYDLGLRAFKAAQEAKTFEDAIGSIKDAVSSGWMKTFELIFGNYEQAKVLWTDLANWGYDLFAEGGNKRNKMLDDALNAASGWEILYQKVEQTGVSEQKFKEILAESAGTSLGALEKEFGSIENAMFKGRVGVDAYNKALEKLTGSSKGTAEVVEDVKISVEELDKVAADVINNVYGSGQDRIDALTAAGYNYAEVQNRVNEMLGSSVAHKVEDYQATKKVVEMTEEQQEALESLKDTAGMTSAEFDELMKIINRPTGRDNLIQTMYNIMNFIQGWDDGLVGIVDIFKEAVTDAFFGDFSAETIYNITAALESMTSKLLITEETGEKIKGVLRDFLFPLNLVAEALKVIITRVGDVGNAVASSKFISTIGHAMAGIGEALSNGASSLSDSGLFEGIGDSFASAMMGAIDIVDGIITKIDKDFGGLPKSFGKVFNSLISTVNSVLRVLALPFEIIGSQFGLFGQNVRYLIENTQILDPILSAMEKGLNWVSSALDGASDKMTQFATALQNSVTERSIAFYKDLTEAIDDANGLSETLLVTFSFVKRGIISAFSEILKYVGDKLGVDIVTPVRNVYNLVDRYLLTPLETAFVGLTAGFYNIFEDGSVFQEFGQKVTRIFDGIKATMQILAKTVGGVINLITSKLVGIRSAADTSPFDLFAKAITGAFSGALEALAKVGDLFVKINSSVTGSKIVATAFDLLTAKVHNLVGAFLYVGTAIADGNSFEQILSGAFELLKEKFDNGLTSLSNFLDQMVGTSVGDTIRNLQKWLDDTITFDGIEEKLLDISQFIRDKFDVIKKAFSGDTTNDSAIATISENIRSLWDTLTNGRSVGDVASSAFEMIASGAGKAAGGVARITGVLSNYVSHMSRTIGTNDRFGKTFRTVSNFVSSLFNNVKKLIRFLTTNETLVNRYQRIVKGVGAGIETVVIVVSRVLSGLLSVFNKLAAAIGIAPFESLAAVLGALAYAILDVFAIIGDHLVVIRDWVKENETLQEVFEFLGDKLSDFVENLTINSGSIKDTFNDIASFIKDPLDEAGSALDGLVGKVKDFFDKITGNKTPKTPFDDLGGNITGGMTSAWDTLKNKISELLGKKDANKIAKNNALFAGFSNVGETLGEEASSGIKVASAKITEYLKKLGDDNTDVARTVTKASVGSVADALTVTTDKITKTMEGSSESAEKADTALGTFAEKVKGLFGNKSGAIATIAVGTLLATSITKVVTGVDRLGNAFNGIINPAGAGIKAFGEGIKSAGSAMSSMATAVNHYFSSKRAAAWAKTILIAAGAIAALLAAVALLTKLDQNTMKTGVICLVELAGALAGLVTVLGLFTKFSKINDAGIAMVSIAGALMLIAAAFRLLDGADPDYFIRNGLIMVAAATVLTLFANTLDGMKIDPKSAASLILLSAAVGILTAVLWAVTKLDLSTITDQIASLIAIVGSMSVLMIAAGKAGKASAMGALSMLGLEIAMAGMVVVLAACALITPQLVKSALFGLTSCSLILATWTAISWLAGPNAKQVGGTIAAMALAMGAMTVVLATLSLFTPDKLKKSLAAMAVMTAMIAMFTFVAGLSNMGKEAASALKGMAAAMVVLTVCIAALNLLQGDDISTTIRSVAMLSALMGALSLLMIAMSKLTDWKNTVLTLIPIILTLSTIAGAIVVFTRIAEDPNKALALVGGMFAVLMATSVLVRSLSKYTGDVAEGAALLVALAAFIGVSSHLIAYLSNSVSDWRNALSLAGGIALVLLAIGGTMRLMNDVDTSGASVETLLAMGVYIVIAANMIAYMTNMLGDVQNASDVMWMAGAIGTVLLAIGASMKLCSSQNASTPAVSTLLGMAVFVIEASTVLSLMAIALQGINIKDLLPIAASLSLVLVALGASMRLMGEMSGMSVNASLAIAAMGVFAMMAGSALSHLAKVFSQSGLSSEQMLSIATGLSMVLVAMGAAMALSNTLPSQNNLEGMLGMAAFAGIACVSMALAGQIFGDTPWQNILAIAAGLSAVLVAMGAALKIVSGAKSITGEAIIGMVMMGLASAIAGVAMACVGWIFGDKSPSTILATATGMSEVLLAMAAALRIAAPIGTLGEAAFVGIAALLTFILGFALVVAAISWVVSEFDPEGTQLDGFVTFMTKLGEGISGFLSGLTVGLASGLPDLATYLSEFSENIKPFIEQFGSGGFQLTSGIADLCGALLLMAGEEFVSAILSLGGLLSGNNTFAEDMKELGKGLYLFCQYVPSQTALDKVSAAVESIQSLLDLHISSGDGGFFGLVKQVFVGSSNQNVSDFAGDLKKLGEGINGFASELTGDFTNVDTAVDNLVKLSNIKADLGTSGGFFGILKWLTVGSEEAATANFADGIRSLGESVNSFGEVFAEGNLKCTTEDIEHGISLLQSFMDIRESLGEGTSVGKLWEFLGIVSDSWRDEIPDGIKNLGDALRSFNDNIVGDESISSMDLTKMDSAMGVIERFASVKGDVGSVSIGSYFGQFANDTFAKEFPLGIQNIGAALSVFGQYILGNDTIPSMDISKMESALGVIERFCSIRTELPSITPTSFYGISEDTFSESFPLGIKRLGEAIAAFNESVATNDAELIGAGIDVVQAFLGIREALGDDTDMSWWDKLWGKDSPFDNGNFADGISDLGVAIWSFNEAFNGIDAGEVRSRVGVLYSFKSVMEAASGIEAQDVGQFKMGVEKLGESVKYFHNQMNGLDMGKIGTGIAKVRSLIGMINDTDTLTSDAGANFKSALETVASDAVKRFIETFAGAQTASQIAVMGRTFITMVGNSIKGSATLLYGSSGIGSVATTAVNALRSGFITSVYKVGRDFVSGFANGIDAYSGTSNAAARRLGQHAVSALKEGIDSNSPSKETYAVGGFFNQGFINAIVDGMSTVGATARAYGEEAVDNLAASLSGAAGVFDYIEAYEPTIRPVLDMSDVRGELATMDDRYSLGQTVKSTTALRGNINVSNDVDRELLYVGRSILEAVQQGRNITIDGKTVIGYVNRGLGNA